MLETYCNGICIPILPKYIYSPFDTVVVGYTMVIITLKEFLFFEMSTLKVLVNFEYVFFIQFHRTLMCTLSVIP